MDNLGEGEHRALIKVYAANAEEHESIGILLFIEKSNKGTLVYRFHVTGASSLGTTVNVKYIWQSGGITNSGIPLQPLENVKDGDEWVIDCFYSDGTKRYSMSSWDCDISMPGYEGEFLYVYNNQIKVIDVYINC